MSIRACRAADVDVLESVLPSGRAQLHAERFSAQQRGECTYLVTWINGRPAAHVMIRWTGSLHEHVRVRFPDVPEIGRLHVNEDLRGHGVGSRLLAHAEQLVFERGYAEVGLAVGVKNVGAIRLYDRLGYEDWSGGTFPSYWLAPTDAGEMEARPHEVTYLTKALRERTAVGVCA